MATGRPEACSSTPPRLDLRLRPQDRTGGPPTARGDGSRRRRDETSAPAKAKPRRRRGGKGRSGLGRLIYWGAVLALWAVIAAIGALVWVGIHLPPIQSLEIPKRPPSVLILGANGATLATRGDMGGAAVPLRELPDYVPKAFVAIEDRRFYSHHGVDPLGHHARARRRRAAPRRLAGRLRPSPSSSPRICS